MQFLGASAGWLLADGFGYHHSSEWGWVMMAGWWLILIVAIVLLVRGPLTRRADEPAGPNAEAILAERFARGDIDADEYHGRLAALRA